MAYLTYAAIAIAALVLAWFNGLLAGPIQGREVQVIRLEPLSHLTPSAIHETGEVAAREPGLLVLRSVKTQSMPAILGQCHVQAGRGSIGIARVPGATALDCRLPAFERSWRQRFAGLVTTVILALAAAAFLLAGLQRIRLSSRATYGLLAAIALAVAARAADPSTDLLRSWVAVVSVGCAAATIGAIYLRRRPGSPAEATGTTTASGEAPAHCETPETDDAKVATENGAGAANGAVAAGSGMGKQRTGGRDRISLAPLAEAIDDVPSHADGLTPPTIGLPSRAARQGAIAAVNHPAYPDTMLDWGQIGDLQLRAASARGASHRVHGRPRQDAFAVGAAPGGGFVIAAVADGVGSSDTSQLGAEAAVRNGVAVVGRRLAKSPDLGSLDGQEVMAEIAATMIASAPSEIGKNARDPGESIATTLVLVAAELNPLKRRTAWCSRTGDSDARLLGEGGWLRIFAAEERSAIASSATPTLPLSPDAAEAKLIDWSDKEALVILSDGLAKPLGSGRGAVGRFLARAWVEPPDPVEFAIQAQFRRRTFDDDRTAVVLWPHESTVRRFG